MKQETRAVFKEIANRNGNEAKYFLMQAESELRDAGLIRKANGIAAIIAKLENWQNA